MRLVLGIFVVALAVPVVAVPNPNATRRSTGMAIPLTKRAALANADKVVDFDTINSRQAFVKAKILRGFENYEKNTGVKHPASVEGVEKRQNGIRLNADRDEIWFGHIVVGTPFEEYTVAFDTAFGDVILPAFGCSTCFGHYPWDPPRDSSTSRFVGGPYQIEFSNGHTATANTYNDTLSIGHLRATEQTIGVALSYPPELQFDRFTADGVMGMGFQSISTFGASPVFQTLVAQRQVDDAVFSFKLSFSGAELYIGGANPNLYRGSFTYVPLTVEGYWQVNIDSIEANHETILSNVPAVIDIGGDLITGPSQQVELLYAVLGGTEIGLGIYALPCDFFPIITFTFGGTSFSIPPSSLDIGPILHGSHHCFSGIAKSNIDSSLWVVGNRFLMNFYTTFDVGRSRIGFAQLARVSRDIP